MSDDAPLKNFGVGPDQRTSNLVATRSYFESSALSASDQARVELQGLFDLIGLSGQSLPVAAALCGGRHNTWKNAVFGLRQWMDEDHEGFVSRLQDTSIRLNITSIQKLISAIREATKPPPTQTVARVRCGDVELKLTLTPKFLLKALAGALVSPFLKAYSKRVGVEASLADVERIEVEGEHVDMHQESALLLKDAAGALRADVSILIILRSHPDAQKASALDAVD